MFFDMNIKGNKMIKFLENPHQILLDAVNELYPNADADIIFLDKESYDEFVENKESYACVKFTDNLKPLIVVCIDVPYVASIELIAHEIAHVVCGYTDDPEKAHGEEWKTGIRQTAFKWLLNCKYETSFKFCFLKKQTFS